MGHVKRSEADWERIMTEANQYPQGITQYCQHHKINSKTFYAWRKRLKGQTSDHKPFVKIKPATESQMCTITTPNGYRIECPTHISDQHLKRIIAGVHES